MFFLINKHDELLTYSFKIEQDKSELEDSYQQLQKLQEQLIESEKMSALGALVAGVSHEINTPLGLTLTSVSYLQDELKKNRRNFENEQLSKKEFKEYLNNADQMTAAAMESIQRAITLVASFKEIAVAETAKSIHCFSLSDYIQSILITYQNKFKANSIEVQCHISKEIMINSEPGLFSQILCNLINNSLRHGFEKISNGRIEVKAEKTRGKLLLTYRDNGQGMDQEQLKKLYEPFYTTKMGQGGSGLGMHIVYNIVKQRLNGSIKCVSGAGKGICVEIQLPVQFEERIPTSPQLLE